MPKVKSRGSVSIVALEAALAEIEEKMEGRAADDQVEELFGARMEELRKKGILTEAIVQVYARKAAEDDRGGLVDEMEQARLLLSRFDERRAGGRRKRSGSPQGAPQQATVGDDDGDQSGAPAKSGQARMSVVELTKVDSAVDSEGDVLAEEAQVSGRSRVLIDESV